jgi:hypothetical protein
VGKTGYARVAADVLFTCSFEARYQPYRIDGTRIIFRWSQFNPHEGAVSAYECARQLFRKLIDGKLVYEPFEENGQRGYRYRATGTYARLFSAGFAVNDGGGGQAFYPSLTSRLTFEIHGVVLAA